MSNSSIEAASPQKEIVTVRLWLSAGMLKVGSGGPFWWVGVVGVVGRMGRRRISQAQISLCLDW